MVTWSQATAILMRTWSFLLAVLIGSNELSAQPRELVNSGTVGLIIGSADSSDPTLASDLVTALNDSYKMRVLPVLGQGSVRNIEDLLYLRGIDIALVQADVLDFYLQTDSGETIGERIRYIAKLASEEVHLLARKEFDSIKDLDGGRVNFGVDGSGSFMTAGILFDRLDIKTDITSFALPIAMKELREGTIDAMVLVGAAPFDQLRWLERAEGLHLLSIPADGISGIYQPSRLDSDDYPNLIASDQPIDTVAVAKILVAFNWPTGHPRGQKVEDFVDRLFERMVVLAKPPYHPKWREVDLLAPVLGWQRLPAVDALIAEQERRGS